MAGEKRRNGKSILIPRHTLPQLPFPLSSLQFQPFNRILQPLLLLNQSPQLRRLCSVSRATSLSAAKRTALTAICRGLTRFIGRESAFLEFTLGFQALFAAGESFHMVGGEGE